MLLVLCLAVCGSCSDRRSNSDSRRLGEGRAECLAGIKQFAGEPRNAT